MCCPDQHPGTRTHCSPHRRGQSKTTQAQRPAKTWHLFIAVDDYRAYWTFLNELYKEARRRMKPGTAQEEVGDEDLGEISIPQLLKKPPLVALNEYCALVLKTKPVLKEGYTQDSKVTHSIQVEIDGRAYGQGNANTKKKARQLAAMNTLEMLFPDLYKVDPEGDTPVVQKPVQEKYDRMDIRDPTLADGYEADNVRAPYLLLQSYMSRYRRHEDPEVKMIEVDPSHSEEDAEKFNANFRFKFEMTYDNITVSDYARSKKHARQRGSQLIMAELHPTLRFWGSVLRMYDQTRELFRERSDEKDLADLALRGNFDKPNVELLERLKTDMRRLYPNRPKEGPTPVPTSAGEILERHWLPDGETGLLPLGRYQPRMERQEERFLKELEDVERREAQVVEELEKEKKN
eukprot:comp12824_c0_seq1/m.7976 comp12824_c0_seq1/g.7976  ORF comp12824_c0_seq1/g.7976 comp12824_c0_seq1/m.7976 type:complete len:404 (-) comp12824_c0_seq1:363-1574(-)